MQRISYCAGSSFVTSDAVASSLLGYARELVAANRTAVVDVPLIRGDGEVGGVSLLLTPTSQLASEALDSPFLGRGEAHFTRTTEESVALLLTPPSPRPDPHGWPDPGLHLD
ncbi:hypothetical protein [Naasia sp. SYSU D00948]|uniref:hypothetical protein n=1 Tax=Naasia sp. SYSU D00948 TaxID=2817379 RepID=UPI001B312E92|nr:hypothetical protein [Naasia sp. SYSU D00948]